MTNFSKLREQMVARQIHGRGIVDARVCDAMRAVARELFVPQVLRRHAYEDRPLPIAAGQTISQPYIVAVMIEALHLTGGEAVLEIGAGSGYAAAVLSRIAGRVLALERIGELVELASANLVAAGVTNVAVRHTDGTAGAPEAAPFDAILVSAASPALPLQLIQQLKIGGRMVVPVGEAGKPQELMRITRTGDETFDGEVLSDVRFVPLIAENS